MTMFFFKIFFSRWYITMRRVNLILGNEEFRRNLCLTGKCEKDRIFCRHDYGHLLDVARLGTILNLKEGCEVGEELIYAAALLHDIGRHKQYLEAVPHELAGASIAGEILSECQFERGETDCILEAIRNHRNPLIREEHNLKGILYRADKGSRSCFACGVRRECNRKEENKNMILVQ